MTLEPATEAEAEAEPPDVDREPDLDGPEKDPELPPFSNGLVVVRR